MSRETTIGKSSAARKTYRKLRDRFGRFLPKQGRDIRGRFMKRRELPPPKWYHDGWISPAERKRRQKRQSESVGVRASKPKPRARVRGEVYDGGVVYRVLFSCPLSEAWRLEEFIASYSTRRGCLYQVCLDKANNYPLYLGPGNRFGSGPRSIGNLLEGLRRKIESGTLDERGSSGISAMRWRTRNGRRRRTRRVREVRLLFVEVERT